MLLALLNRKGFQVAHRPPPVSQSRYQLVTRPGGPLTEPTTVPFQPTSSFMPTTMSWRELCGTISESKSLDSDTALGRQRTFSSDNDAAVSEEAAGEGRSLAAACNLLVSREANSSLQLVLLGALHTKPRVQSIHCNVRTHTHWFYLKNLTHL